METLAYSSNKRWRYSGKFYTCNSFLCDEWILENSDGLFLKKIYLQEYVPCSEKWKLLYDAGRPNSTVKLGRFSIKWGFKHTYVKLILLFFFSLGMGVSGRNISSWCVILDWFPDVHFWYYFIAEHFSENLVFWASCWSKILIAVCQNGRYFARKWKPFWCALCLQFSPLYIRRI